MTGGDDSTDGAGRNRPDVTVVGEDDLSVDDRPGPSRAVAFDTDRVLLVRTRLDPGHESDWHSHPRRGAYAYVLSGRLRLEYGADGDRAVEVGTGGFAYTPAGVVHRDVDPGDGELVALAAFVGPGNPVASAEGPPDADPADPPRVAGESDLTETAPLENLTRKTPFPDAPVQQVRGHADGRIASEFHHHGDNDVFGYVIAGEGYVEWGHGEDQRALARAGEFFRVPAGVVHRDVNPSDGPQDYVLWLTGSEPRNVPVDGPDPSTW